MLHGVHGRKYICSFFFSFIIAITTTTSTTTITYISFLPLESVLLLSLRTPLYLAIFSCNDRIIVLNSSHLVTSWSFWSIVATLASFTLSDALCSCLFCCCRWLILACISSIRPWKYVPISILFLHVSGSIHLKYPHALLFCLKQNSKISCHYCLWFTEIVCEIWIYRIIGTSYEFSSWILNGPWSAYVCFFFTSASWVEVCCMVCIAWAATIWTVFHMSRNCVSVKKRKYKGGKWEVMVGCSHLYSLEGGQFCQQIQRTESGFHAFCFTVKCVNGRFLRVQNAYKHISGCYVQLPWKFVGVFCI